MAANLNAQITTVNTEPGALITGGNARSATNVAAVDASGSQDVIQVLTRGKSRLAIEASNVGVALTEFKVWGKVLGGDFIQLLGNAAADYTTPIGPLKYSFGASNAATSPITLASGAKVMLMIDCQGFDEMKCTANCGTATVLTMFAQAS